MTQLTNYSIEQEKEILDSIRFDHQIENYSYHHSMKLLNNTQKVILQSADKEPLMHIYYEFLTDNENTLLLEILNMIGKFGTLTFWQLQSYVSENSEYYTHQKTLKQVLKILIRLNLVEKLIFTVTTEEYTKNGKIVPPQERQLSAFVLTTWAKRVLQHTEREITKHFPKLNRKMDYGTCISCWRIYDLDSTLKKKDYYIDSFIESNKKGKMLYHCWLENIAEDKVMELVVAFPLQMEMLRKVGRGYGYDTDMLKRVAETFEPHFYGTNELPPLYRNKKVTRCAVIRVSKKPKTANFVTVTNSYKGTGKLVLLMGNGYDDSSRFDKQYGGDISKCFYYEKNVKGKDSIFQLKIE